MIYFQSTAIRLANFVDFENNFSISNKSKNVQKRSWSKLFSELVTFVAVPIES